MTTIINTGKVKLERHFVLNSKYPFFHLELRFFVLVKKKWVVREIPKILVHKSLVRNIKKFKKNSKSAFEQIAPSLKKILDIKYFFNQRIFQATEGVLGWRDDKMICFFGMYPTGVVMFGITDYSNNIIA